MRSSFVNNVQETFQKHGIEDEKLELVMTDLFDSFQDHLLSNDFVDKITEKQERKINLRKRFN